MDLTIRGQKLSTNLLRSHSNLNLLKKGYSCPQLSPQIIKNKECPLFQLPNEILIKIVKNLSQKDLLSFRSCCVHLAFICRVVLSKKLSSSLLKIFDEFSNSFQMERTNYGEVEPSLNLSTHYLQNTISIKDLNEIASLENPPKSIRIVSECLVRLSKISQANNPRTQETWKNHGRVPWTLIQKELVKPSLRAFVTQLSNSVLTPTSPHYHPIELFAQIYDVQAPYPEILQKHKSGPASGRSHVVKNKHFSQKGVGDVSRILHSNQITYERMQRVSQIGFLMLCFIAACVQYSTCTSQISEATDQVDKLISKMLRVRTLRAHVDKHQQDLFK